MKRVQHLPGVPVLPCLAHEEQIVNKSSLFFPGRGCSPVSTPTPTSHTRQKVQPDRVEVTLLDFWPHGPPRAGITSQVHLAGGPLAAMEEEEGPEEAPQLLGARVHERAPPISEPSPSVSPPWALASPQPLITPRCAVHLSSSCWPEKRLGAGRCLAHHQEVISGCTGDCCCREQAGLPGVAAWPLSLVLTPSAPRTRCPGPVEAQLPSPGFLPCTAWSPHGQVVRALACRAHCPRGRAPPLHPLNSSQSPAKSLSITLIFVLNLAPYGPSSQASSNLGSAPVRPLHPFLSHPHSTSSPDPPAQIMAQPVENRTEDHFMSFHTKSNLPE